MYTRKVNKQIKRRAKFFNVVLKVWLTSITKHKQYQ